MKFKMPHAASTTGSTSLGKGPSPSGTVLDGEDGLSPVRAFEGEMKLEGYSWAWEMVRHRTICLIAPLLPFPAVFPRVLRYTYQ